MELLLLLKAALEGAATIARLIELERSGQKITNDQLKEAREKTQSLLEQIRSRT